jgi:hypothetical protein
MLQMRYKISVHLIYKRKKTAVRKRQTKRIKKKKTIIQPPTTVVHTAPLENYLSQLSPLNELVYLSHRRVARQATQVVH